jgi:hypothetical protein
VAQFQIHHIIPQAEQFSSHPVILLLEQQENLSIINSQNNLVRLPATQELAAELGQSPHTGGHLELR